MLYSQSIQNLLSFAVNLFGVASQSTGDLVMKTKENVEPVVETVGDIKDTIGNNEFVQTVTRGGSEALRALPDIISTVSDIIQVVQC